MGGCWWEPIKLIWSGLNTYKFKYSAQSRNTYFDYGCKSLPNNMKKHKNYKQYIYFQNKNTTRESISVLYLATMIINKINLSM